MSEEPLYDVIFIGDLALYSNKDTIIQQLATLFHSDESLIIQHFKPGYKVKQNVSFTAAKKYMAALTQVGATCKIGPTPKTIITQNKQTNTIASHRFKLQLSTSVLPPHLYLQIALVPVLMALNYIVPQN